MQTGQTGTAPTAVVDRTPGGDLFELAESISVLLDAPVSIEDQDFRLLAHAGHPGVTEQTLVRTVLDRQVPLAVVRSYRDRGVYERLYSTDRPIFVADVDGPGSSRRSRVAIAVRASSQVLGSIWAAVRTPPTAEHLRTLEEAAKVVALQLLRHRADQDLERRLRTELVSIALDGGFTAADAMCRLGLDGRPALVVAMSLDEAASGEADCAERAIDNQRVADALAMHLNAVLAHSVVAVLGDRIYAIVALGHTNEASDERALAIIKDFQSRLGERRQVRAGVGPVVQAVAGVSRSRAGADRALRVLQSAGDRRRACTFAACRTEVYLQELADLVAAHGDDAHPGLSRIAAYDERTGNNYLETLDLWLDSFGDCKSSAQHLFIHTNTLRYRVRQAAKISGMDLDDPHERFNAMLELKLHKYRRDALRRADAVRVVRSSNEIRGSAARRNDEAAGSP